MSYQSTQTLTLPGVASRCLYSCDLAALHLVVMQERPRSGAFGAIVVQMFVVRQPLHLSCEAGNAAELTGIRSCALGSGLPVHDAASTKRDVLEPGQG